MTRAQRSGKTLIVAVSERDVVETKNPSSKLDKGQLCRIQLSVSSLNRIGHKTVAKLWLGWLSRCSWGCFGSRSSWGGRSRVGSWSSWGRISGRSRSSGASFWSCSWSGGGRWSWIWGVHSWLATHEHGQGQQSDVLLHLSLPSIQPASTAGGFDLFSSLTRGMPLSAVVILREREFRTAVIPGFLWAIEITSIFRRMSLYCIDKRSF